MCHDFNLQGNLRVAQCSCGHHPQHHAQDLTREEKETRMEWMMKETAEKLCPGLKRCNKDGQLKRWVFQLSPCGACECKDFGLEEDVADGMYDCGCNHDANVYWPAPYEWIVVGVAELLVEARK